MTAMKAKTVLGVICALVLGSHLVAARGNKPPQFPRDASFTTLSVTPLAIEGLTGDDVGNLFTTGRAAVSTPCPVWRIAGDATPPVTPVPIGSIPNTPTACNPSGITFDAAGNIYVSDANLGGVVWRLTKNADGTFTSPAVAADAFATGVPGTNGLAFDRDGNLWTGDGTTGQGRVWRVGPTGGTCEPAFVGCEEVFRIQPMRNSTALGGDIAGDGVGRQVRSFPPGTLNIEVLAAPVVVTPAGGQDLVANGVAFTPNGDLIVADTARGALWKVEFEHDGSLKSETGCDTTFAPNTLCLDNIFVAHPALEGTDGIALDAAGNIWNAANERNAIVVVTKDGRVAEIFRTPVNAAGRRNAADLADDNARILEFPTSPFLSGKRFCTSNSDGNRRDNSPNSGGQINSGGAVGTRGKISCMDQALKIPGLRLPVQ